MRFCFIKSHSLLCFFYFTSCYTSQISIVIASRKAAMLFAISESQISPSIHLVLNNVNTFVVGSTCSNYIPGK